MSRYQIFETEQFLNDVEEAAVWILQTNSDQSEEFALTKLSDFQSDIKALKNRLRDFRSMMVGIQLSGL
jgi:cell division septum initiation protein DivIVA